MREITKTYALGRTGTSLLANVGLEGSAKTVDLLYRASDAYQVCSFYGSDSAWTGDSATVDLVSFLDLRSIAPINIFYRSLRARACNLLPDCMHPATPSVQT